MEEYIILYIIPAEERELQVQEVLHKYSARYSKRIGYAAMIHNQKNLHKYSLNKISMNVENEYINHVVHPDTGKPCGYT